MNDRPRVALPRAVEATRGRSRFAYEHLRDARRARGWTMAQLRARSGVATSTISRTEIGIGTPTVDVLVALLNALDLGADLVIVRDIEERKQP
jgi:transcriptional regulator with XRE-family HTH domain